MRKALAAQVVAGSEHPVDVSNQPVTDELCRRLGFSIFDVSSFKSESQGWAGCSPFVLDRR